MGSSTAHSPLQNLEHNYLLLSDVHLGHHRGRSYLEEIVSRTNRYRPDIVLISGDLVDSEAALLPGVLSPLSQLDAPAYFVGGNHEDYIDTDPGIGDAGCLQNGISQRSATDGTPPAGMLYYMVRAENACGGGLGNDSSGLPHPAPGCP